MGPESIKNSNKLPHDKTNEMTFVPSEDSDQPGQCAQWEAKDSSFLHEDRKDSDQTVRTPRLIQVFAGHTNHFVGFIMRQLSFTKIVRDHCLHG